MGLHGVILESLGGLLSSYRILGLFSGHVATLLPAIILAHLKLSACCRLVVSLLSGRGQLSFSKLSSCL